MLYLLIPKVSNLAGMNQMSAKVFLDTNILVYSYSYTELEKQDTARMLISGSDSHISTQILQELANIITRKLHFDYDTAQAVIKESCQNNKLHINTQATILQACSIARQSNFSFYDSLIIASALESDCEILYSEDMQDGQKINGLVQIINPFKV